MIHFENDELTMSRRLHELGLRHPSDPGTYFLDLANDPTIETPLQSGVHLVWNPEALPAIAGGADAFAGRFAWLPIWEDGCEWLKEQGVPIKHVYATIKEGVLFYGERERLLLYGEIERILILEGKGKRPGGE